MSALRNVYLSELLAGFTSAAVGGGDPQVSGLALDSRKVVPGDVFVALKGDVTDGRDYIEDAVANGAVAALVEADTPVEAFPGEVVNVPVVKVPVVEVPLLAAQLSALADRLYEAPSKRATVIGVTGTNGKTSCALLMAQLAAARADRKGPAAVIGTLGYGLTDELANLTHTGLTTPDAASLQKMLHELVQQGAHTVAMEVSSHSLVQRRAAAVSMPVVLITNLTRDHLDYHGDLKAYGDAKALILQQPGLQTALLNADDDWANALSEKAPASVKTLRYSLNKEDADIWVSDRVEQRSGVSALMHSPWGEGELHSPLLGEFNLSNLLGSIAALCAAGMPLAEALAATPTLRPAPGRMEPVVLDEQRQDVQVVVDYAHTPDALENTLKAMAKHNTGRLWCVFGCGGDRDRGKRPLMGRIAEQLSDYVVVTNDNPRTEDPAQIAADILKGMNNDHQCLVIADRAQAIDLAIQQARAGDTVLVSGKGHEDYQIFATETIAFSDRDVVSHSLRRRLNKQLSAEGIA
ncbi:UDP-N-acetylmuramoyl-L-alanyl-D-glutamate--2,6-diaminopimelate ligase [Marinimicrobium sp. ARAG 43.8]|uniref:UDP-N-acetylmuramoyl-L-alanyl-D-glutamate--2, 6-diaminopimelate ligase n=1 Tax=Marinimicrobium sp. ARAG 43.8 TaxID=3418719 RepID=UPI003CED699C